MANRMLRDWTCSDKMNNISVHAERFFTRLIMKVDDYGCFFADTRLLRANLFPLLLDSITDTQLNDWLKECARIGLICVYENSGKKYLQILDFKQRLDRAKSRFPQPTENDLRESVNDFPAEVEQNTKPKGSKNSDLDKSRVDNPDPVLYDYRKIPKDQKSIMDFISEYKPGELEPYADLWNLFAKKYKCAEVAKLSDTRKKHLAARLRDKDFDFIKILSNAAKSSFALEKTWFTFDWIISSKDNYIKVIEGNYIDKEKTSINAKQEKTINDHREDEGRAVLAELHKSAV